MSANYMKSVAPTKNGQFNQGYFKPTAPDKYINIREQIIYRSSYELIFCKICDTNAKIIKWQSEPFNVEYFDPITKKKRQYYPDYLIVTEDAKGINKIVIEIKPLTFLTKPNYPAKVNAQSLKNYNFRMRIFVTNMAKFKAAKVYCEARGMTYSFLTDQFFNKFR